MSFTAEPKADKRLRPVDSGEGGRCYVSAPSAAHAVAGQER